VTNLRYIKRFYMFYSQGKQIRQQAVDELIGAENSVELKSSLPSIEALEEELRKMDV